MNIYWKLLDRYLSVGIADKYWGHGFDNGAAENITKGQIENEDIVGGTREVWEVSEDDEEENIEKRSKHSEEKLRHDKNSCFGFLLCFKHGVTFKIRYLDVKTFDSKEKHNK